MATSSSGNTTVVSGDPLVYESAELSEDAKPGHLVEYGGSSDLQKHSTSGGDAIPMFIEENPLDAGQDWSTATDSGDTPKVAVPKGGERITARAATDNFSDGDFLQSNGDGTLTQFSAQSIDYSETTGTTTIVDRRIVAVIPEDESINNSGGSGGEALVVQSV
jgi:hypothetical protein